MGINTKNKNHYIVHHYRLNWVHLFYFNLSDLALSEISNIFNKNVKKYSINIIYKIITTSREKTYVFSLNWFKQLIINYIVNIIYFLILI